MARLEERYDREHAVVVRLGGEEMAKIEDWIERTADPYGKIRAEKN